MRWYFKKQKKRLELENILKEMKILILIKWQFNDNQYYYKWNEYDKGDIQ